MSDLAATPGETPSQVSAGEGLQRNLAAAFRAATLRRVPADALVARPAQFLALVLLNLLLELAIALGGSAGAPGHLDLEALPRVLFHVPLALLAGLLVASVEGLPAQLLRIAVLFAGVRLWYGLIFGGLDLLVAFGVLGDAGEYDDRAGQMWYGVYALWLLAMLRGAASLSSAHGARRILHALAAVAILAAPLWFLPGAELWRVDAPQTEDTRQDWFAASREEVIYAQPALLDQSLARVERQRPGVVDLYFVGVAGYAAEDVFMKEVNLLDALFRERFDAQGRSVKLVNNPKTVAEVPVASATALARTLEHLGRVMDRDEDVLFLYLTSHGSEEHRLSMEFWPLQLNDFDPHTLRQMLDRAGIRWRVVAISACYSGGFIEALRDERTLVLTAAEASRQSFGCGTESDLTYFGRAYDEALRATYSFTQAFERARAQIAAREQAEALLPSNPQIYAGSLVGRKLEALRVRLERAVKER